MIDIFDIIGSGLVLPVEIEMDGDDISILVNRADMGCAS